MKRCRVTSTVEERGELAAFLSRGRADVRRLKHALMLLKADAGPAGPGWPACPLACEPLAGWRHAAVTDHRRRVDWAGFVRGLLDGRTRGA